MTRERYPDTRNAGRSKIVPFIPGEGAAQRHGRRLTANLAAVENLHQWTARQGLTLRICNGGHHWIFSKDGFFRGVVAVECEADFCPRGTSAGFTAMTTRR